jgi:hypothetical protein
MLDERVRVTEGEECSSIVLILRRRRTYEHCASMSKARSMFALLSSCYYLRIHHGSSRNNIIIIFW